MSPARARGPARDPGSSGAAPAPDRPHPLFARLYARASGAMEEAGMADLRRQLVAGLSGVVVEVGAGNGMTFAHYPPAVTTVHAVEPEPHLRRLAQRAAAAAPVAVEVSPGVADGLPLADESADAAVLSLVLCSVDDVGAALREVRRVLRPGGEVRFLEHTVAPTRRLRRVQRVLDATVWPRLAGGCHTARDPVGALRDAGFEVTALRRLRYPDRRLTLPVTPHAMGTARAPRQPPAASSPRP